MKQLRKRKRTYAPWTIVEKVGIAVIILAMAAAVGLGAWAIHLIDKS